MLPHTHQDWLLAPFRIPHQKVTHWQWMKSHRIGGSFTRTCFIWQLAGCCISFGWVFCMVGYFPKFPASDVSLDCHFLTLMYLGEKVWDKAVYTFCAMCSRASTLGVASSLNVSRCRSVGMLNWIYIFLFESLSTSDSSRFELTNSNWNVWQFVYLIRDEANSSLVRIGLEFFVWRGNSEKSNPRLETKRCFVCLVKRQVGLFNESA